MYLLSQLLFFYFKTQNVIDFNIDTYRAWMWMTWKHTQLVSRKDDKIFMLLRGSQGRVEQTLSGRGVIGFIR